MLVIILALVAVSVGFILVSGGVLMMILRETKGVEIG